MKVESDDEDEESDEDEAKKPATSDKPQRSSRDKERRKNRRKLESKLKDAFSIISTATEIQGQEVVKILKHVYTTVQGDREVPRQGRSEQGEDRESTAAERCETPHRGNLQPVPKHPRTDAIVQQGQADGMAIRRRQLPQTSRTSQPRSRASARNRNVPVLDLNSSEG